MKSKFLKKTLLTLSLLVSLSVGTFSTSYAKTFSDDSIKNTKEFKVEQSQAIEKAQKLADKTKGKHFSDTKLNTSNDVASTLSTSSYPTRSGVILVTTDGSISGIGTGHAGIVWSSATTVESFPDGGVQTMPNNWNSRYNSVYGVTVKGTTSNQDDSASNWCYNKRGDGYNWDFWNTSTRSKFYCSQLVWAAFNDKYDINLDDDGGIIWPVDLVNTKNTSIVYEQ